MKYLLEHEVGFDNEVLGFPSIQGCHAVVYQTDIGLFGFHVAGNSGDDRWVPSARIFAQFVNGIAGGMPRGIRLYGATFVGNNARGYSVTAFNLKQYRAKWKPELIAYASALGYAGKISGYDLHKSFAGEATSAYVEFRAQNNKSDLYVRQWRHNEHAPKQANPDGARHKVKEGRSLENQGLTNLANVVSAIGAGVLNNVSKEKLR